MTTSTIERVCEEQKSHLESIEHGKPERLSEAMTDREFFAQGDFNIGPISEIPEGYRLVKNQSNRIPQVEVESRKQLVRGNTVGAKHCLAELRGVEIYEPENWTDDSLLGPVLVFLREGCITHPTHGHITVPAGMTVQIAYQREYDAEERRERRARD